MSVAPPDGEGEGDWALGTEDPALDASRLTLHGLVEDLPVEDRTVVLLYFFEGRTQQDIAARLGSNQVSISRRLSRVLAQLRDQFEDNGSPDQRASATTAPARRTGGGDGTGRRLHRGRRSPTAPVEDSDLPTSVGSVRSRVTVHPKAGSQ
jgi:hypothetical protein